MQKESSLITVSSTIKKFILFVVIITILIFGWNTLKNIPGPIVPDNPVDNKYTYLKEKNLIEGFKPQALESINGISLYSKAVLTKGTFPVLPQYVYIYSVTRPVEDFATAANANSLATKFNYEAVNRTFQNNLIMWKKGNTNLIIDRSDLSMDYFLTNPSLIVQADKDDTFKSLNEYIVSFGLNLKSFDLNKPEIFSTKYGKANIFFRYTDYIAMNDTSLNKYIEETKLTTKAKILDKNNYSGELTVEMKEAEKFHSNNVIKFSFVPLNFELDSDKAGVYKLLDLKQAFQEINTYKVETNSDSQENVKSGNLYNFITFNNTSYPDQVDFSQIDDFVVSAEKTTIAYIINSTDSLLYLHPIYVFTGEGILEDNNTYTFFIYVDALPKG